MEPTRVGSDTCISDSLFVINTAKRSLENVVVDVHVRTDGRDSAFGHALFLSGNHYHSVRKLIGKFIIDNEEKFQCIIDKEVFTY